MALLVEDEPQIRRFVRTALEAEGWTVHETATMKQGLIDAGTRKPDLLILDLGLPDGDGVTLIRELRGWSSLPVIVLSARMGENDKIEALDAGADDYLTKPFAVGELLARLRVAQRHALGATLPAEAVVTIGELTIDRGRGEVTMAGAAVHLTPLEFKLLMALSRAPGRVMTHDQLLREVWGPGYTHQHHYLRVHMGNLRHKLEAVPSRPRYLLSEPGVGYRLREE